VRYERPFQMEVEVDVVQGFANSILQFLRKSGRARDDPVNFNPEKSYPADARNEEDFGRIELEELIELPVPKAIPGI